jgi:hypothetical protein
MRINDLVSGSRLFPMGVWVLQKQKRPHPSLPKGEGNNNFFRYRKVIYLFTLNPLSFGEGKSRFSGMG